MTKMKRDIWDRAFDLDVVYDCYEDEFVTEEQKAALDAFPGNQNAIGLALPELERYCLSYDGDKIGDSIPNIFKYVIPTTLYIPRRQKTRTVILLCDYRFDAEEGLALVFENEKLKEIAGQSSVL